MSYFEPIQDDVEQLVHYINSCPAYFRAINFPWNENKIPWNKNKKEFLKNYQINYDSQRRTMIKHNSCHKLLNKFQGDISCALAMYPYIWDLRGEEGQPHQSQVRTTFSSVSPPNHLEILVLSILFFLSVRSLKMNTFFKSMATLGHKKWVE